MADDLGAEALAKAAQRTEHVVRALRESAAALERMTAGAEPVVQAALAMAAALRRGRTVFAFGNGGSAADAQHFTAELVGRYEQERRGWPAVALTTDTSALTAVGNDYGFDRVFSRQIEALSRAGDIALGITTSGNSPNVLRALEAANARGLVTIALTGRAGAAGALARYHVCVLEDRTPRVQEVHATLLHVMCELMEMELANG